MSLCIATSVVSGQKRDHQFSKRYKPGDYSREPAATTQTFPRLLFEGSMYTTSSVPWYLTRQSIGG